jgi:uncharacterized membrane protein YdjX (TVP38/TMEM64 family)
MTVNRKTIIATAIIIISCIASAFLFYKISFLANLWKIAALAIIALTAIASVIALHLRNVPVYRLCVTITLFALFFGSLFYLFDVSGFWDSISTEQGIKKFIEEKGFFSSLVFFIIQVLQVVAIPIPGAITITVGYLLFGFWWGSLISFLGIVAGSVLAFLIGRKFGYKLVVWIVGEDKLNKAMNFIRGKDKVIFAMIFLLPFFPDDILCFVAGLTPMSLTYFTCMAMTTRIITISAQSLFMSFVKYLLYSGSVTGYILLGLMGAALLAIFIITVKYAKRIQSYFENKFDIIIRKIRGGKKNKEGAE